jgi:hypothetical protein
MAKLNGTQPEFPTPPSIEIDGETYESRDVSRLSHAEEIELNTIHTRMSDLGDQLRDYADIAFDLDDDNEDDGPPLELVQAYTHAQLGMIRFGFRVPKLVLRRLRDAGEERHAEISQHASTFVTYITKAGEVKQGRDEQPDPTRTRSGRRSRASRASSKA